MSKEHLPQDIGSIAVRFSAEDTPSGWKNLDDLDIPLTVRPVEDDLAYIFAATHWADVKRALMQAGLPYRFKGAAGGFTKDSLEAPDTWQEAKAAKELV
jgi:hypothetical protein